MTIDDRVLRESNTDATIANGLSFFSSSLSSSSVLFSCVHFSSVSFNVLYATTSCAFGNVIALPISSPQTLNSYPEIEFYEAGGEGKRIMWLTIYRLRSLAVCRVWIRRIRSDDISNLQSFVFAFVIGNSFFGPFSVLGTRVRSRARIPISPCSDVFM